MILSSYKQDCVWANTDVPSLLLCIPFSINLGLLTWMYRMQDMLFVSGALNCTWLRMLVYPRRIAALAVLVICAKLANLIERNVALLEAFTLLPKKPRPWRSIIVGSLMLRGL